MRAYQKLIRDNREIIDDAMISLLDTINYIHTNKLYSMEMQRDWHDPDVKRYFNDSIDKMPILLREENMTDAAFGKRDHIVRVVSRVEGALSMLCDDNMYSLISTSLGDDIQQVIYCAYLNSLHGRNTEHGGWIYDEKSDIRALCTQLWESVDAAARLDHIASYDSDVYLFLL